MGTATGAQPDWSTVAFLGVIVALAAALLRANGVLIRYWRDHLGPTEIDGWQPSREYWAEHPPDVDIVELGHRWQSATDPDALWSLSWDRGRLVADRRPALPPPVVQGVFGSGGLGSHASRNEIAAREMTRVVALGVPRRALDELAPELARWSRARDGADALLGVLEDRYEAVRTDA